jgi:hypothetical protein
MLEQVEWCAGDVDSLIDVQGCEEGRQALCNAGRTEIVAINPC